MAYISDLDLEDYSSIAGAKLVLLVGHSEYWTRQARQNFDRFVDGGGNALVLSGNTMWWQVRYSEDFSQMICYKYDAHDPIGDPLLATINWTQASVRYPTQYSIGADFPRGGFGLGYPNQGGFQIVNVDSPIFRGVPVRENPVLAISTVEYDGAPLLEDSVVSGGVPRLDMAALGAFRAEIIGYEHCARDDAEATLVQASAVANNVATWIAYQKTATSGTLINGASTNWCSRTGAFGPDGLRVRKIILNMMDLLVNRQTVFST